MKSKKLKLSLILKNNRLNCRELIKKLEEKDIDCIMGFNVIGAIKSYRIDKILKLSKIKGKIITNYPADDSFPSVTKEDNYEDFLLLNENFLFHVESIRLNDGRAYIE